MRQDDPDAVAELLALKFEPTGEGAGQVDLLLAGGGCIRLEVEAIEAALRDISEHWPARRAARAQHRRQVISRGEKPLTSVRLLDPDFSRFVGINWPPATVAACRTMVPNVALTRKTLSRSTARTAAELATAEPFDRGAARHRAHRAAVGRDHVRAVRRSGAGARHDIVLHLPGRGRCSVSAWCRRCSCWRNTSSRARKRAISTGRIG